MGLLDDLEQEAERRRSQEAKAESERTERDRAWREILRPGMEALAAYLKKLTDNLAFLKRRIRLSYALPGYGTIVAYADAPFELRDAPDKGSGRHEITLDFSATIASEECPAVDADSLVKARALISLFQQHRIGGMQDSSKNANGDVIAARFQARGKIHGRVAISADRESCVARMQFSNVEALGTISRSFPNDALTDSLFDALGRYLTREDATFAQEEVREDVRRQLQSKIQRDQLKREWEDRLSRQVGDDEAKVLSYMGGIGGNAGSVFGRIAVAARKLLGR